jgi:acyl-CoA synthetase (AMP-forming)/AMP-acid ligase II
MIYNEVEVVDAADNPLPTGQVGEVRIKAEQIMRGYWQNPAATAETLRDGWIYSGDYGRFDEDGFLYVVGRKKEVIISGGENIYPREIEEVLNNHPGIREVAVVGVPDDKWGEAVKAVIVLKPDVTLGEAEVIDYCKEYLAGFKKPKSVEFRAELPKSPLGKILKAEIRKEYWQHLDRQI